MAVAHIKSRHTDQRALAESSSSSDQSLIYSGRPQDDVDVFEIPIRVGDSWAPDLSIDPPPFYAVDPQGVEIAPQSSVVIETAENFVVPKNLYGVLFPKGGLLQRQGIFMPTAKIDPTFEGHLRLLLFNTSQRTRRLAKGTIVGSAVFIRTETTTSARIVDRKEEASARPLPIREKAKRLWSQHHNLIITGILMLLSGAISGLLVKFL